MNCIFAAHIEYRNISIQKKLSACAKPPYLILPPCIPSPYSVPPHACPPPILSHPMHTLPLFCPTPCMPSPYSIPPMHALPLFIPTSCIPPPYSIPAHPSLLFYPSPCIPSPYSIQPHAYPAPYSILAHAYLPPILSQLMHTLLPISIPAYTHPILFHPIHALPLFYPTVCMSSPVLYQPTHATPVFYSSSCILSNSLSHEPGRHISPLTSENAAFEFCSSAHTEYIIIIYLA